MYNYEGVNAKFIVKNVNMLTDGKLTSTLEYYSYQTVLKGFLKLNKLFRNVDSL